MISPCRIHRTCRLIDSLSVGFLFAAFLLVPYNGAMGQYATGSTSETAGAAGGATVPLDITAGVDIGYDDHVIGSNAASSSGQSSFFARENLVLSYDRARERTQLHLIGVGRFDQFFDAGTDDKDVNVTLALTHDFSKRLSFRADVYAAYQTEPNFQSNVGPENVRAPHFNTHDILSLSYHWLPRFATVTTYEFNRTLYSQSSSVGTSSNRTQQTLGEQLQFSLTSRLSSRVHSTAAVYYPHDENGGSTSPGTSSAGTQNSLQLSLGLRYTINKRFSLHVDYRHSSVGSQGSTPGYSRNSYSAGLTFTY